MPRQRPAAVVVVAVLNLVFGGLGLFCTVCSGVMSLAGADRALANVGDAQQRQQAEVQKRRQEILERVHRSHVPLYKAYTVGNRVLTILLCAALLASGVGLLLMQGWARWVAVSYGGASILANLVGFVYTLAFMMPADVEAFRQVPPQNDTEKMAYTLARVAAPGMPCAMMIYPVVVITLMLLPSVGAAFRNKPRRLRTRRRREEEYDEEPEDDDEDDDYRPRRPRRR